MRFTKLHGAGNDFVLVNTLEENLDGIDLAGVSRAVCARRFGIGSDGFILVETGSQAAFRMRMFNPDGSPAQMCGNGIRCFGKYLYDHGLTTETSIPVETDSGVKLLEMTLQGDSVQWVKVDMGAPELRRSRVPLQGQGEDDHVVAEAITVHGMDLKMTCISMGVPHCIIFVDDVEEFPVEQVGPRIERHSLFPQRTNVPFVQVRSVDEMQVRVWERGAGETLACGTGACAATVAGALNGLTGRRVLVRLRGGDLNIEWAEDGRVMMEGPASEVYTGDYPL